MTRGDLVAKQAEMKERMKKLGAAKLAVNFSGGWPGPELPKKAKRKDGEILSVKIHRKTIRWTKSQYKRATGPMVYIFWGLNEIGRIALYVGYSHNGLIRALHPNHHMKPARDRAIELEFVICESPEDAARMERHLIRTLKPEFNTVVYTNPQLY